MHLPTPSHGQDVTQGQFFRRSLKGLNSEFSFCYTGCLTKAKEPSLPYYLPIAGAVYIYIYIYIYATSPFRLKISTDSIIGTY